MEMSLTPRLYSEDRQAIADVTHALQTWNRYTLTIRRQDADLVFVVRKGRLAAAKVFAGVHSGSRTSVAQTPDQDPNRDGSARYQTLEQRPEHPVRWDPQMTSSLWTQ
jgi:hypothetical protein